MLVMSVIVQFSGFALRGTSYLKGKRDSQRQPRYDLSPTVRVFNPRILTQLIMSVMYYVSYVNHFGDVGVDTNVPLP